MQVALRRSSPVDDMYTQKRPRSPEGTESRVLAVQRVDLTNSTFSESRLYGRLADKPLKSSFLDKSRSPSRDRMVGTGPKHEPYVVVDPCFDTGERGVRFARCTNASVFPALSHSEYDRTPIAVSCDAKALEIQRNDDDNDGGWIKCVERVKGRSKKTDDSSSSPEESDDDDSETPGLSLGTELQEGLEEDDSVESSDVDDSQEDELEDHTGVQDDEEEEKDLSPDSTRERFGLCGLGKYTRGDVFKSFDSLGGF